MCQHFSAIGFIRKSFLVLLIWQLYVLSQNDILFTFQSLNLKEKIKLWKMVEEKEKSQLVDFY